MGFLAVESEAGALIDRRLTVSQALPELIDALRQGGVETRLEIGSQGPVVCIGVGEATRYYTLKVGEQGALEALASALSAVIPSDVQLRVSESYEDADAYGLVVLGPDGRSALASVLGESVLDDVLRRPPPPSLAVQLLPAAGEAVEELDWAVRHRLHPPIDSGQGWEPVWEHLQTLDPRMVWPIELRNPPGQLFYELTSALAGPALSAARHGGQAGELATVLYRWARATLVGCLWDVVACRYNPGMSAQGVLGFGQLIWAYFVFEALGADDDADSAGRLLDDPWVREQERALLFTRQRAYYDLGLWLRSGQAGPQLLRLRELLPLAKRPAWNEPNRVEAGLKVHAELHGDQLTHAPLYFGWAAPLHALARRAQAQDLIPADNPFLAAPLSVEQVDLQEPLLAGLRQMEVQLMLLADAPAPPLLDPLPVIVEVRITEVRDGQAIGHPLVSDSAGAEHRVKAPCSGLQIAAGETWALRAESATPARGTRNIDGMGDVAYRISHPTGSWICRLEP